MFSLSGWWGYHSAWVAGSRGSKALSAPEQWGGERMLGCLAFGSLRALWSTQSSHLASAPCQETSDPSLQGSSAKSSRLPACSRNPQGLQNVNMPQLSTGAVFILWSMDSGSLTNSQGSVKGDKTSCQQLSFAAQRFVPPPLEKTWVSANGEVANYGLGEC